MYDKDSDKEQETKWLDGDMSQRRMPIEKMANLVVCGFHGCGDDYCFSREYCSSTSCECIRAVFPSSTHYELYLKLRSYILTAELIAKLSGENDA